MKPKRTRFPFFLLPFFFLAAAPVFPREQIIDNAGLLTAPEKAALEEQLARVISARSFDLVIVTETSTGNKSPGAYADDFFDYNGYGAGEGFDGCLFLVVTGTGEYWFSSSGRGNEILHSYAGDKLEADAERFLREAPFKAFSSFARDWDYFLDLESKGRRYNFFERWNSALVAAAWVLALAAGFIVVSIWKKGMNTVIPQTQAAGYIVPGSLAFREKKDRFLYSTLSRTPRPRQTGPGGGGGIHRSSSGRTHGGRGGRY